MRDDKQNIIVEKSIEFSLAVIKYCDVLEHHRKYVVARQFLRCATSIGANIFETQNAESKADFIHKMKIAAKEASETLYWLILCEKSENYHFDATLKVQLDEIIKILSKIISTSKTVTQSLVLAACFAFSNFQILKLIN